MPQYDLSGYDLGRVANQDVDMLLIDDTIVWTATPPIVDTVFMGNTSAMSLGSYNDSPSPGWLAEQFLKTSGDPVWVHSVGMLIPSGSLFIGQTGEVSVQAQATAFTHGTTYSNTMRTTGNSATGTVVEGWNFFDLDTSFEWTDSTPYLLAGYGFGSDYLYDSTLTVDPIVSEHGFFELIEFDGGGTNTRRCWYDDATGIFGATLARAYGIDIRVKETA